MENKIDLKNVLKDLLTEKIEEDQRDQMNS